MGLEAALAKARSAESARRRWQRGSMATAAASVRDLTPDPSPKGGLRLRGPLVRAPGQASPPNAAQGNQGSRVESCNRRFWSHGYCS
jgi:hypothetical protein